MPKVWRKCCGERSRGSFPVSSYPSRSRKVYLWNDSPLPPVMLIALFGITVISDVHCTVDNNANPETHRPFPSPTHPHVQGSSPLPYHPHHHQHGNLNHVPVDGDNEDGGRTIYECPEVHYPKELEILMKRLTEMGRDNEDEEGSEGTGYSEGNGSIRRNVSMNDVDDCSSSKPTGNSHSLWSPNRKLFGNKELGTRTKFRICSRPFKCPPNGIKKEFHWHPLWQQQHNLRYSSIQNFHLSNMSLIKGGYLVWNKEEGERHVFRKEEYCISRRGVGGWVSFMVCNSNCSDLSPCVRKCCPPSQVIGAESKGCIPANPSWRPIFYKSASEQEKNTEFVAPNASIIVGFPNCPQKYVINATQLSPQKYVINASPLKNFKLLLNGTLVQIDGPKQTHIEVGEFCIDGVYYGENMDDELRSKGLPIKYSRSEWDQIVIACMPNTQRLEIDKWRIPLYASLNCVSVLFLLLTNIVYLLLWKHQNIHGWLQFSYSSSLLLTFVCFVVVQTWSKQLLNISRGLCKIMGCITHLAYLSAFFWLTSMNFDLWWRFSRPLRNSRMRPQERKFKRYLGFAGISIGIPLLISSIGITLDGVYDEMLLDPPFTVPGFGKDKCYFESKRSQIPYLYGPAGVLLLIDMIFFTSTVLHLRKIHAHTNLARSQSTLEDKKGLRVIAKLFIVMGVLWVFELASWIAYILFPDKDILLIWIFIPIDVLNCLQGVAIFFIFVCKPNVGNQLMAIFRRDDAGKTWNKQAQHPSVATVQQTIKPNDYIEIK